jgi:hypothetical protein
MSEQKVEVGVWKRPRELKEDTFAAADAIEPRMDDRDSG